MRRDETGQGIDLAAGGQQKRKAAGVSRPTWMEGAGLQWLRWGQGEPWWHKLAHAHTAQTSGIASSTAAGSAIGGSASGGGNSRSLAETSARVARFSWLKVVRLGLTPLWNTGYEYECGHYWVQGCLAVIHGGIAQRWPHMEFVVWGGLILLFCLLIACCFERSNTNTAKAHLSWSEMSWYHAREISARRISGISSFFLRYDSILPQAGQSNPLWLFLYTWKDSMAFKTTRPLL